MQRRLPKWLLTFVQRAKLAAIPKLTFEATSLGWICPTDLKRAFNSENIPTAWERDWLAVSQALPNAGVSGTNEGERRAIYYLIVALKPHSVLEIGTHRGATSLLIAQALATHVPQSHLVTLDIVDAMFDAQQAAQHLGLSDLITFQVAAALPYLRRTKSRFDLIFLDGSHSAPDVYREVAAAIKLLNPNGLILLHDYHPGNQHVFQRGTSIPGPYLAFERIRGEGAQIDILPFGSLPWQTRSGEHATCLALLRRPYGGSVKA